MRKGCKTGLRKLQPGIKAYILGDGIPLLRPTSTGSDLVPHSLVGHPEWPYESLFPRIGVGTDTQKYSEKRIFISRDMSATGNFQAFLNPLRLQRLLLLSAWRHRVGEISNRVLTGSNAKNIDLSVLKYRLSSRPESVQQQTRPRYSKVEHVYVVAWSYHVHQTAGVFPFFGRAGNRLQAPVKMAGKQSYRSAIHHIRQPRTEATGAFTALSTRGILQAQRLRWESKLIN